MRLKTAAIVLSGYEGGIDPLDVIRAQDLAEEILKVVICSGKSLIKQKNEF